MEKRLRQFDIVTVNLDPTSGSEIRGTRPCVILQTNAGMAGKTVLVAPLTSQDAHKATPYHVPVKKSAANGLAADSKIKCEQVRSVAVERFGKRLGTVETAYFPAIFSALDILFDRRQDFAEGWWR